MIEPKRRARIRLLHHIIEFSLQRRIGGHAYSGLSDMAFEQSGTFDANREVRIGDLVALQSSPSSKWYLSWVIELLPNDMYALESIEDGQVINWSNVGLIYYNRTQVEQHPEWRWTDKQFEFNDRWYHCCNKDRDASLRRPCQAQFGENDSVALALRHRWGGLGGEKPDERTFPNWRKTTKAMMLAFYDEIVPPTRK